MQGTALWERECGKYHKYWDPKSQLRQSHFSAVAMTTRVTCKLKPSVLLPWECALQNGTRIQIVWCQLVSPKTLDAPESGPAQKASNRISSSDSPPLPPATFGKANVTYLPEVMSRVKRLYSNTSLCSALLWCPGFSRSSLISFPPSLSCHVDNTWSGIWGVYAQIKWLFGTSRSILRFAQNDFNLSACWASGSDVTLACLSHWLLLPAPVFHSKATALCSVHPDKYIWAFWLN